MEPEMRIGTPEEGYRHFCNVGPRTVEMALDHTYGNLGNVPDEGRGYMLRGVAAMSYRGDVYRIDPRLRLVTRDLFAHLAEAGVPCMRPEDVVWHQDFGAGLIGQHADRPLEVFFFNEAINRLRPDQVRLKATCNYENKCDFFTRWQHTNACVPRTCVVRNSGSSLGPVPTPEEVWEIIGSKPGRLKANRCASGNDNEEFKDLNGLARLMDSDEWRARDYVVQEDVGELDASANYFADETGVYFLFTTLQTNSGGKVHESNVHEYRYRVVCRRATDSMAYAAWLAGVRGFFGFDLRVLLDASRAWVIECNARPTAPAYAWLIAQKMSAREWLVSNLKEVRYRTINTLVPRHLRYSVGSGQGVIVHNPGSLEFEQAGSVSVLGPTTEICAGILQELKEHACDLRQAA